MKGMYTMGVIKHCLDKTVQFIRDLLSIKLGSGRTERG